MAIDDQGVARVFRNGTQIGQDAYFLQPNGVLPKQLEAGWPLIWNNNSKAIKTYRIAGTPEGSGSFDLKIDLKNWSTASGETGNTGIPLNI